MTIDTTRDGIEDQATDDRAFTPSLPIPRLGPEESADY